MALPAENGHYYDQPSHYDHVCMAKKFPLHPSHPERICWGCDKYCPADSLNCGNGSGRTQHPVEVLGDDWYEHGDWGLDLDQAQA